MRGSYSGVWTGWSKVGGGDTAATGNTVVERDGAGDINVRLVRSEYDTTNATIGYIMTQIDTASNNYIRPSTPAQVMTGLGAAPLASPTFTGTVTIPTLTVTSTANPGLTVGNGTTGYAKIGATGWYDDGSYFSPLGTRPLYIRGTTPTTYIYSPTIYLGSSSGTNVLLRGNNISGTSFSIPASGNTYFNNGSNVGIGITAPTYKLQVNGSFAATYKNFDIPHPLDPDNKRLIHSSIEGPEHAVYYRGEASLAGGQARIELPAYFEALTRKENRTVLLTNIDGFDRLAVQSQDGVQVKDGAFVVYSSNANSSQKFSWEVKAVRSDVPELVPEIPKPAEGAGTTE
jgi:hypothetical protein